MQTNFCNYGDGRLQKTLKQVKNKAQYQEHDSQFFLWTFLERNNPCIPSIKGELTTQHSGKCWSGGQMSKSGS